MSASFFLAALKIWHHKKRGTFYQVHSEECRVQCETPLQDGELVYLYRNVRDGSWSVRRGAEFNDGRFEDLGRTEHFYGPPVKTTIQVFHSDPRLVYEGLERRTRNDTVPMNRRKGIQVVRQK